MLVAYMGNAGAAQAGDGSGDEQPPPPKARRGTKDTAEDPKYLKDQRMHELMVKLTVKGAVWWWACEERPNAVLHSDNLVEVTTTDYEFGPPGKITYSFEVQGYTEIDGVRTKGTITKYCNITLDSVFKWRHVIYLDEEMQAMEQHDAGAGPSGASS